MKLPDGASTGRLVAHGGTDEGDDLRALLVPAPKRRSTLLTVCPFILGNEFCERLAFYGLSTNLVIYLARVMGESPAQASIQQMVFEGTCYLTPLLGAWLADSRWGRYKTILVFSTIYFVGMVCVAVTAAVPGLTPSPDQPKALWYQNLALFGSLYIVALGTGGIKPNVSAFGADQFDESDPQDRKDKSSFFNFFYFVINLGSLLAVTVVVYIQDSISWAIGFAVPAVAMALAISAFLAGSSMYTHVEPTESPMTRVVKVLSAAARNAWRRRREQRAYRRHVAHVTSSSSTGFSGPVNLPPYTSLEAGVPRVQSYNWLHYADVGQEDDGGSGLAGFSAEQVEEVRMVVRMLPIFVTTIFYWTIYAQMGSFFVEQGAIMDREVADGRFTIPAASLALFNTLGIILLIPCYDRMLIPLLRRFGKKLSLLERIGWGLLVCIFAMLAAGGLEYCRLALYNEGEVLPGGIVDINVFWQVPQYLLIGLSEVLASVGQLEFFYDQAPDIMRSCSMALQLLSVAIGSYLSGAVVWGVGSGTAALGWNDGLGWLPADMNKGRLDLFFLFLAGLSAINMVLFLWVASSYQYKDVPHTRARAPRKPPLPRAPGGLPTPTAAGIAIQRAAMQGVEDETSIYGRSVTFIPPSPSLPAPFR